jgi:hypothetical protein
VQISPDSGLEHLPQKDDQSCGNTVHTLGLELARPDLVSDRDKVVEQKFSEFVGLADLRLGFDLIEELGLVKFGVGGDKRDTLFEEFRG